MSRTRHMANQKNERAEEKEVSSAGNRPAAAEEQADSGKDTQKGSVQAGSTREGSTREGSAKERFTKEGSGSAQGETRQDGTGQKGTRPGRAGRNGESAKDTGGTGTGKSAGSLALRSLPFLFFAVTAVIMVYYILVASKGEFHSDCTDTIMWADASIQSGEVYNPDFQYACFLPFGTNLLMKPLIRWMGLSMEAHVYGMLGFFILFTLFFCLMLHEMQWKPGETAVAAAALLALLLSSPKLREIFWGHTIYYSLGILFLFTGMYLYLRFLRLWRMDGQSAEPMDGQGAGRMHGQSAGRMAVHKWLTFGVLLLFILGTGTDGVSAISIFLLPFLAALLMERLLDASEPLLSRKNGRTLALIAGFGIACVVGMLLNKHWMGDLEAWYQKGYSGYSEMGTWMEHVQKLPVEWLRLLGVQDMQNVELMSAESLPNLFYILAGVLLAVLPVLCSLQYQRYEKDTAGYAMRLWIWIHWAVTGIVLLGYICGKLATANWRLSPIVVTSIVVSIQYIKWCLSQKPQVRLPVFFLIPIAAVAFWNLSGTAKLPSDPYDSNVLYQLNDYLEEAELYYGYATFWRANAITVISGDYVQVRSVKVSDDGQLSIYHYQSDIHWYDEQKGQEEYFLLLDQGEYNSMVNAENPLLFEALRTETVDLEEYGTYYVLVFDHNLF